MKQFLKLASGHSNTALRNTWEIKCSIKSYWKKVAFNVVVEYGTLQMKTIRKLIFVCMTLVRSRKKKSCMHGRQKKTTKRNDLVVYYFCRIQNHEIPLLLLSFLT